MLPTTKMYSREVIHKARGRDTVTVIKSILCNFCHPSATTKKPQFHVMLSLYVCSFELITVNYRRDKI